MVWGYHHFRKPTNIGITDTNQRWAKSLGVSPPKMPVDSEGPVGGQKGQKGETLIGDSGWGINCFP